MKMAFTDQIAGLDNDGLLNVYTNPADYQVEYVKLVEQELIKRGINPSDYETKKGENLANYRAKLSEGKKGSDLGIIAGFVLSALGGLWGIIIGLMYATAQTSDSAGVKYPKYDKQTRKLGRMMVILAVASLLLSLAYLNGEFN